MNTVRVKIIRSVNIFKDGIHGELAKVGQTHELPHILAEALIRDKFAEEIKGETKDGKVSESSSKTDAANAEAKTEKVEDNSQKKNK